MFNQLIKEVHCYGTSFYTPLGIRHLCGDNESYKDFSKLLENKKSLVKKYAFINDSIDILAFEIIHKKEKLEYHVDKKNMFHYVVLHKEPDSLFKKGYLSYAEPKKVNAFGFFHIKHMRLPIRSTPEKFVGYFFQASEAASINSVKVSKNFYCGLDRSAIESHHIYENTLIPKVATSYPYFEGEESYVSDKIFFEKKEILQLFADNKFEINVITKPDIIFGVNNTVTEFSNDSKFLNEYKQITKLNPKTKTAFLNIIGAFNKEFQNSDCPRFTSQNKLIEYFNRKYPRIPGVGTDDLGKKLSKANKSIAEELRS